MKKDQSNRSTNDRNEQSTTSQNTNPSPLLVPDYQSTYAHAIRHNQKKTQKQKGQIDQQNLIGNDMAGALNDSLDALDNDQDVYDPNKNENNSEEQW